MAYREAAGCSANNRMEVSARKLPLIPPTRLRPAYSKGSLVSVTMNNVNPRTGAVFFFQRVGKYRVYLRVLRAVSPPL